MLSRGTADSLGWQERPSELAVRAANLNTPDPDARVPARGAGLPRTLRSSCVAGSMAAAVERHVARPRSPWNGPTRSAGYTYATLMWLRLRVLYGIGCDSGPGVRA